MFDWKKFRKDNKLTQKQLAELFGCTDSNLSMAEKSMRNLEEYQLKILYEKYGELIKDYFIEDIEQNDTSINKVEIGVNSFLVPCIPLRAEAGTLSGFSDSVMPYESFVVASPVKGADFAIDIHGDSMEPDYPSGCRVFVQKIELDFIKEGYVYVFDTVGGIILKEVAKLNADNLIYHSLNPKYSDETLAFADIHSNGVYRVLGCLTFK